jgi:group I intron endonuclease
MAVIYGLVHIASGKMYVGCTAGKPAKRFREHRCLLNNGKHTSAKIQAVWSLDGSEAFKFDILEDLGHNASFERRKAAEQRWIDAMDAKGLLYNAYRVAFSMPREVTQMGIEASRHVAGNRWTPEANEKRRQAQLGKPKGHGAKISATKRARRAALLD